MKRVFKTVLLSLMACVMTFTLMTAMGCDNNKIDPDAYTVILLKADGTPYANMSVQLCVPHGMCLDAGTTDKNGKIVFKSDLVGGADLEIHPYKYEGTVQYVYFNGEWMVMSEFTSHYDTLEYTEVYAKKGESVNFTIEE